MCVCVCVHVHAYVRARACVRACVRVCVSEQRCMHYISFLEVSADFSSPGRVWDFKLTGRIRKQKK